MKAQEARTIANKKHPDRVDPFEKSKAQAKIVYAKIKDAAENGEYDVEIDGLICGILYHSLKRDGYSVEYNGKTTAISFK